MYRKYLILIILCIIWVGCNQSKNEIEFDPSIDDLKLVKLLEGQDAIAAINKLHGTPLNVVRGYIAHYEGVNDKATIWVSEASSQELAQEQIEVMISKMKNNRRSPFSHYRNLEARGLAVIAFNGLGQVHYVFRDNKWVYWISADSKRIDKILEHINKARLG